MLQRSICIFPHFDNMEKIDFLRKKYDRLYRYIPPHLTLVFPFKSTISQEVLTAHIQDVLTGMRPFQITLQGITGSEKYYLFLNVKKGNDLLLSIHDKLYTGILEKYLHRKISYFPHLTVGRLANKTQFEKAITDTAAFTEEFTTVVKELSVEQIDEANYSHSEFTVKLRNT
ncbi:2'-5' RNA ligase [Pullulanibacillus camelliae]|uniref:2'-5' RNA ligase n=1 Tax=Pullulanibacillus camelliae TaxID=1707096 RepID=A0A8J2YL02_9BACL|nr:2'-5' RNA ligase family protein [Pullulanibacillus camelliae]GGE51514.1 2'-5' RNA ligase [Pullulanibacillus camelliae]